jgi:hypothetical protein
MSNYATLRRHHPITPATGKYFRVARHAGAIRKRSRQ